MRTIRISIPLDDRDILTELADLGIQIKGLPTQIEVDEDRLAQILDLAKRRGLGTREERGVVTIKFLSGYLVSGGTGGARDGYVGELRKQLPNLSAIEERRGWVIELEEDEIIRAKALAAEHGVTLQHRNKRGG